MANVTVLISLPNQGSIPIHRATVYVGPSPIPGTWLTSVRVERQRMQRPWYCPWCDPVPVWREIGVNRISIGVGLRYFTSSVFVLFPIRNFFATSTASDFRSGMIKGMRSNVTVTIGGGVAAQTSESIVVTEGDIT